MVKKLFRMTITFATLTAVYFGYSQAFAFFASRVATVRKVPLLPELTGISKSQQEAADLAVQAFGPGHWATKAPMRYYDVQRGYWIYWNEQTRLNEGKTWEFKPIAIITRSKKDGPLKTITGDTARVDFNRPFDAGKPGDEPARIIHALMRDNVRIRDDKGTADIADDLTTEPMQALEYDEAKEHIVGLPEERVVLRDRGLTVVGFGMEMQLRRKASVVTDPDSPPQTPGPANGFDGVKALTFLRDVEIDVQDVGRSGIVPGGSGKDAKLVVTTDPTGQKVAKAEPRPGHIQCSGMMRIDLPRPRRVVPRKEVPFGPPAPPEPTIATFHKNVRVRQGDPQKPEQMDCDHLVATLMPGDKKPAVKGKAAAEAQGLGQQKIQSGTEVAATKDQTKADDTAIDPVDAGPLSGLLLHRAVATGHAVWLQSDSNGLKALGNELRYYRYAPEPDQIFLRADRETEIVKTDYHDAGKDKGKPQTISTIRTRDVTIFQYPAGTRPPSMVARGPGTLETRAAGKDEVERFASWQDSLQMVSAVGSEQRQLTLSGHPRIRSITQGDISAQKTIVADLYPKEKKSDADAVVTSVDGKPAGSGDALQIRKLVAEGDVHLVTVATPADPKAIPPKPASPSREITARETLTADFRAVAAPAKTPGSTPDGKPIIESRDPVPAAAGAVAAADPVAPAAETKPAPPARPAEPAMTAVADRVWAMVLQQEGSDKSQIQDAKLTGNVQIHQDSKDGKTEGSSITAQAVLIKNSGENRAWVQAFGTPEKPAVATSEARTIIGPILTLDQATDHAWVKGAGRLEMAQKEKDFLDDTAPMIDVPVALVARDQPKKPPLKPKGPLIITWGKQADDPEAWMNFYGRPVDANGETGPAMALFHSNVKARTDDSSLDCENLKATFDGPIAFVKPRTTEVKPRDGEKEPGPQIAFLHAKKNVDIIARKFDPETGYLKDKKRILHDEVTYDKSTGQFVANGPGSVYLYTTSDDKAKTPGPLTASTTTRRIVQPVTARVADDEKPKPPKLSLTHVRFTKSMAGRFTPAEDAGPQDYSTATFLGSVEAVMAPVPDETVVIDADRLPPDFYRIVSRKLDVQVEPPPVRAEKEKDKKESDRVLLDASGGAKAFTPKTAIDGDRITYDSLNELSYVYGGTTGVGVVNQDGAGQPATTGRGSALFHDHKKGLTKLIDPQTFQIIDPSSGQKSRLPGMAPPPRSALNVPGQANPKLAPQKPNRNDPFQNLNKLRIPSRSDKERKSFSGK